MINITFFVFITIGLILVGCIFPGYAQIEYEEWKTYINPELGFSINYPEMKFMHITEHETLPSVLIAGDFFVMIDLLKVNDTIKDSRQIAELTANTQSTEYGSKILQDIHPVIYANKSGHSITLYNENPNSNSTLITKYVFLPNDNKIYQFYLEDDSENYHEKTFEIMVNSTKFY